MPVLRNAKCEKCKVSLAGNASDLEKFKLAHKHEPAAKRRKSSSGEGKSQKAE